MNWSFFKRSNEQKNIIINFGPQHPAAHGVLRLILQLSGEVIIRADPHIGLLHRGTEHLITTKTAEQAIPYFDRLDYVSMMTQEHSFCLGIEYLLGCFDININVNWVRILFDELTRVLNHLLAIACHALDVGSMSSIFWGFEEREKLMEFYERISGARMHAAFHRPGAFNNFECLHSNFLWEILFFTHNAFQTLNEIHNALTYNKIWKQRLVNVGLISLNDCQDYSLTGVMARSVGSKRDLRLSVSGVYSGYEKLLIKSFIGVNGDTFDRYLIRMSEMGESLAIISTVVYLLLSKWKHVKTSNSANNSSKVNTFNMDNLDLTSSQLESLRKTAANSSMEDLISHFLRWHSSFTLPNGVTEVYIESPKGEFGLTLFSNNTNKLERCKIRSPSYCNLQFLPKLTRGHYLADLAALIGTIDIVFGEVDR